MKNLICCLAAAFLTLGLMTNSATAQEKSGFPFPAEQPAPVPSPVNPAQKIIESGKVMVVVGSERNFGYRLGDVIPVTIIISVDPGVKINTEPLRRKVLVSEGSDFEMTEAPFIVIEEQNNKTIYKIHLHLRSWVIKPALVLNAEFYYATEILPDNVTPNWRLGATPDFVITTSNTSSALSKELLEGDMNFQISPKPWLVSPLRYAGFLLISALPAWLLYQVWRRARPVRFLSPAEKAWRVFDRVIAQIELVGVQYQHMEVVSSTLRQYLGIEAMATAEVQAVIDQFFDERNDKLEMLTLTMQVLTSLDHSLYSKKPMANDECGNLFRGIERLVPHP